MAFPYAKSSANSNLLYTYKDSPKASNGIILEQGESSKPAPRDTPKAQPKKISKPLLKRLPIATCKSKYSGRVRQEANNLKQVWHVDPFKSTENSKWNKIEIEVEIVGDNLPGEDCHPKSFTEDSAKFTITKWQCNHRQ